MTAFFTLIKGKEWAGQERAFLTGVFVADTISILQYQAFMERLYKQDTHLDVFLTYANETERQAFAAIASQNASKEVVRMRQAVIDKNAGQVLTDGFVDHHGSNRGVHTAG